MKIPKRFTGHFAVYMYDALKSGVAPKPYDPADNGPEVELIQNFHVFPEGWRGLIYYTDEEARRACDFNS
jgi:hypothetical protein